MPARRFHSLSRSGPVLALVLLLGACTPGGQFDPTEPLSSDIFASKKKLPGEREPLFPQGVPGAETGVPPDLVKGYQPPPEQPVVESSDAAAKSASAAKPKPKPKPKVARVPAVPPQAGRPAQAAWPPPSTPGQGQPAQAAWPPPPSASSAQTNWPPPAPPAGQPAQGAAAQTNWPPPPRQTQ